MTARFMRRMRGVCCPVPAALLVFLALCASLPVRAQDGGTDAAARVPAIYWIDEKESQRIGARVLDMVNAVRRVSDKVPLAYVPQLNAAAFAHASDLNSQQKTWNFSAAGTSPVVRAARAGYRGTVLAENVVQAFDPPLVVIHGMLLDNRARDNLLHTVARDLGLGWYQNEEGRVWWVLITGR